MSDGVVQNYNGRGRKLGFTSVMISAKCNESNDGEENTVESKHEHNGREGVSYIGILGTYVLEPGHGHGLAAAGRCSNINCNQS